MKLTEEDAVRLLRAAAEGEAEYRAVCNELGPKLSGYVKAKVLSVFASLYREARMEPRDVAQEVMLKLYRRPPTETDADRALPRILRWLKTVTRNFLLDKSRQVTRRTKSRSDEDWEEELAASMRLLLVPPLPEPSTDPSQGGRLGAVQEVAAIRALMEACQPSCVSLFDLMLEGDELSSDALAERLDTTRANVDTLKRRMRVTRDVWIALEQEPALTLEELSERIGRPANRELKRTQRKVRNYVATCAVEARSERSWQ